jgi:hypothetical protein
MKTLLASLLVLAFLPSAASAHEMSGPSFRLRGATLSGGGSVDLQSTAPDSTLGGAGTTIGQSSPIGMSEGPTSRNTLEGGFWAVVATPVPEPSAALFLLSACAALALLTGRCIRACALADWLCDAGVDAPRFFV